MYQLMRLLAPFQLRGGSSGSRYVRSSPLLRYLARYTSPCQKRCPTEPIFAQSATVVVGNLMRSLRALVMLLRRCAPRVISIRRSAWRQPMQCLRRQPVEFVCRRSNLSVVNALDAPTISWSSACLTSPLVRCIDRDCIGFGRRCTLEQFESIRHDQIGRGRRRLKSPLSARKMRLQSLLWMWRRQLGCDRRRPIGSFCVSSIDSSAINSFASYVHPPSTR